MDNTIVTVAVLLYRLMRGETLGESDRERLNRYFGRFGSFPAGMGEGGQSAEWIAQYQRSGLGLQAAEEWHETFKGADHLSPEEIELEPAEAEAFIRVFIGHVEQLLRSRVSASVFCGESVKEQNSVMDYASQHAVEPDEWLLHLTSEGQCLLSGDQQLLLGPGQLLFLPPNSKYETQRAPGSKRWVHCWIRFTARPEWLEWSRIARQTNELQILSFDENTQSAVNAAFAEIMALSVRDDELANRIQYNRIEHLLLLGDDCQQEQQPILDARVQQAISYIREHYADDYTVEFLAQVCHLSTARFAALFKQELGVSPMQWRDQLRIREAQRLLLNTSESVARISEKVGYIDQLHFSRRFKKLAGTSPRNYRKEFG